MGERGAKPEQGELFLPAGFRFHPRDDEIITSYLLPKFLNPSFSPRAMGEVNLNQCEPRDLPSKAKMGEKEWYFFCHKDMKYPTGMRTNRATKEGYWKATGRDREIFEPASAGGGGRELVGMKKTLVFYTGRAPRGSKTNWVMHEFRLEGKSRHNADLHLRPKDEWVVCKVFNKDNGEDNKKKAAAVEYSAGTPNVSSISAVDATGDEDDDPFINPTLHPMYFNSTSSLPDLTTIDDPWLAPPYSAGDYSTASTAAAAATSTTSSFLVDLPYYTFSDSTVVPTSSSSSYNSPWNMLHAGHPVGSYNLHDQGTMVKALGGVSSPSFAGGLTLPSSTVPGISQQNYSLGHNGSFGTNYLTSSASASASASATVITGGQAAAKNNLGA